MGTPYLKDQMSESKMRQLKHWVRKRTEAIPQNDSHLPSVSIKDWKQKIKEKMDLVKVLKAKNMNIWMHWVNTDPSIL